VQALARDAAAAKEADREQREELAENATDRKAKSESAASLSEREGKLVAALPAVIGDLARGGNEKLATFLAKLSFARYRVRVVDVDPASPAPDEGAELKAVERVERADIATRASGLAALCKALRKPGREPIVAELSERGIDAAALDDLSIDAEAVAAQGRNQARAAAATDRELAAVRLVKARWSELRRLLRRAVKGDKDLEVLYAAC
jgi:hypothetical protein